MSFLNGPGSTVVMVLTLWDGRGVGDRVVDVVRTNRRVSPEIRDFRLWTVVKQNKLGRGLCNLLTYLLTYSS